MARWGAIVAGARMMWKIGRCAGMRRGDEVKRFVGGGAAGRLTSPKRWDSKSMVETRLTIKNPMIGVHTGMVCK